jgi:hypothetical protein
MFCFLSPGFFCFLLNCCHWCNIGLVFAFRSAFPTIKSTNHGDLSSTSEVLVILDPQARDQGSPIEQVFYVTHGRTPVFTQWHVQDRTAWPRPPSEICLLFYLVDLVDGSNITAKGLPYGKQHIVTIPVLTDLILNSEKKHDVAEFQLDSICRCIYKISYIFLSYYPIFMSNLQFCR